MSWIRERRNRDFVPVQDNLFHVSQRPPGWWFLAGSVVGICVGAAPFLIFQAIEWVTR